MKARKFLMIAVCSVTALLAACGTREDTEPDSPLRSSGGNSENENRDSSPTPTPEPVAFLTIDEATKIARTDAGISEDELENLHARLDEDEQEYTVTFATTEKAYQYQIAASSGMILEKNVNTIDHNSDTQLSSGVEIQPDTASTAPQEPASATLPAPDASSQTTDITQDEAVEIARKEAGVSENEMFNLRVKLDFEDGVQVYEIDFDAGTTEYEYEIAVSGGRIISRKSEPFDHVPATSNSALTPAPTSAPKATSTPVPTTAPKATPTPAPTAAPKATSTPAPTSAASTPSATITQDAAVEIARKDAGVSESEMFNLKVKLDFEDGIQVYEIDFDAGTTEYEYEIAVSNGRIISRKSEPSDRIPAAPKTTPAAAPKATSTPAPAQTTAVTQDAAVAIARKDAGVSESEMFNLKTKLDYEDGVQVYEIDFDTETMEYEYEIAVSDGTILKKESESRNSSKTKTTPVPTTASQTGEITQDAAVEIAGKDAGVSESAMMNLKVKLDYDDGVRVYEIEFYAGDKEYEYKIAASNGTILEKEVDNSDRITSGSALAAREISKADALAIVQTDTSISEADMLDLKVEVDSDDGVRYYDFEFCCGGYEYEYEIATADGRILKKECDDCDHSWHHADHHSSHH